MLRVGKFLSYLWSHSIPLPILRKKNNTITHFTIDGYLSCLLFSATVNSIEMKRLCYGLIVPPTPTIFIC